MELAANLDRSAYYPRRQDTLECIQQSRHGFNRKEEEEEDDDAAATPTRRAAGTVRVNDIETCND